MDRQIVDPDHGKNYDAAISTGEPHFKMRKIYTLLLLLYYYYYYYYCTIYKQYLYIKIHCKKETYAN